MQKQKQKTKKYNTKKRIKEKIRRNTHYAILISITIVFGIKFLILGYHFPTDNIGVFGKGSANAIQETPAQEVPAPKIISRTIRRVTAYNAGDPTQTDDTPCISANGENICTALALGYKRCASNFVPFGTRLHIQHYGECLVVDRMNGRYPNSVDVAMTADEKIRAKKWGEQFLEVAILK